MIRRHVEFKTSKVATQVTRAWSKTSCVAIRWSIWAERSPSLAGSPGADAEAVLDPRHCIVRYRKISYFGVAFSANPKTDLAGEFSGPTLCEVGDTVCTELN